MFSSERTADFPRTSPYCLGVDLKALVGLMNTRSTLTLMDCLMTAIAMTVTLAFMQVTIANDATLRPALTADNNAIVSLPPPRTD
jgi:hypothetical protein